MLTNIIDAFLPVFVSLLCSMAAGGIFTHWFSGHTWTDTAAAGLSALLTILAMSLLLHHKNERINCRRFPFIIPGLPLGAALSYISSRWMTWAGIYTRFSNESQASLLQAPFALSLIVLGVLTPISEELVYRGIFYARLKKCLPHPIALAICVSCFSLGHGNIIQIIYALPMGLLLCLAEDLTQDLAAPVAIHAGANLLSVLVTFLS